MAPTMHGTDDGFVPDPEDWPTPDPSGRSPEAMQNETDDLAEALPRVSDLTEADEADVVEQLREGGPDAEDGRWSGY